MNIKTIISIIMAIILLIATIVFFFFTDNKKDENSVQSGFKDDKLVIKYIDGEVVLLNNEKIIEKFSYVNFEILPTEDKLLLEDGILVSSIGEAHTLIEDYDG